MNAYADYPYWAETIKVVARKRPSLFWKDVRFFAGLLLVSLLLAL